jgi:hypothetical protein
VVRGGDPKTSPKIKSAVVDVDSIGIGGAYTASMTSAGPLVPVVQGERLDRERQPHRKDHGSREVDHLARHRVCTHTTYLARHCQQDVVGSPPRAQDDELDGDARGTKDLSRFGLRIA